MDISILCNYLDKVTLQKQIIYPEFEYTKGISVLFSGVSCYKDSKILLGTLSVWKNVIKHQGLIEGATYLICNDQADTNYYPSKDLQANFFLLNTSLEVLLHALDQGISMNFAMHKEPMKQSCRDFINDLKNGYLSSVEDAKKRFMALYYPVHPHIGCIIIKSENDTLTIAGKDKIELAISSFFPETNYFFYEKEWIVFYTQEKETTEKLDFSYEDFSKMLKANNLYAAISYPCQRPELLYLIYKTTSLALAVGLKTKYSPQISRIFPYKDLNMLFVVHLGAQRFKQKLGTNNIMYLAHPDAVKIYYHDLDENDNFLEILTVYLRTGQSITESSKLLYMHRNTVHNKISKIKELIHLDLENGSDCYLLLMSCMLLQYQKECEKLSLTDFL